jgi:hypothetical protein
MTTPSLCFCALKMPSSHVVPAKAGTHNHRRFLLGQLVVPVCLKGAACGYGSRLALRLAGTTMCEALLPPPEQFFDIGELQFDIGRPPVVALP